MANVLGLRCRECGADYPHEPLRVCDQCTVEAVSASVASPSVINARLQDFGHLYASLAPAARRAAGRE